MEPADGGLKALFFENRPILLRFLAARRATPDEAEDVLQDLFVRLETHAVGPVAQPIPYLCRMADNLLVDHRRSAAARTVREEAWVDTQFGSEVDDSPSPERHLIGREALAAMTRALAELPERTIHIFRRYRIEGAPQRQIADELEISVSAVEKHLHKAYQAVVAAQSSLDAETPHLLRSQARGGDND
ncbi:sigma-70 family RNA polymerase sigma factor [Sphingosinicella sp. LHD-64]|uniref:RNA polymerase sigma factor n=1 Tax=Sphingosinicella sp. LHD-64 TaxID=3072139 RepID=UPI00280C74FC|nr:sigma-70 family RNA polymerase sigma factor [Sphingosinicella sp. LHD-64]MDQ8757365.1 sigma-70 family RNA polymerase sigma factor [Sphingosinicella sp. LHD-64]